MRYRYRAAHPDGAIVRGFHRADSPTAVIAFLQGEGLLALEVAPRQDSGAKPLPAKPLATAFRGLATFVSSGMPLDRALAATAVGASRRTKAPLEEVRRRVLAGQNLSAALASLGGCVPRYVIAVIAAGERVGNLDAALDEAAAQLEADAELRSGWQQALAYPIVLTVGGVVSLIVIVGTVIPNFAAVLSELGQDLPGTTQLLLSVTHAAWTTGPFLVAGASVAIAGLVAALRSGTRMEQWHELLLRIPLVGVFRRLLATARLARVLGGSLEAGLPIVTAMQAAEDVTVDRAILTRLHRVRDRLTRGENFTDACRTEALFTGASLELIGLGERSGRLGEFARRAGELAARELERRMKTLVAAAEPALVIVIGGLIALVATSMLQAVYALRPGLP